MHTPAQPSSQPSAPTSPAAREQGASSANGAPWLSVVAPCYNEQAGLTEFHRRVSAVCQAIGKSYEIVLVNDGSRDRTWEKLTELSALDPHVVAIDLARNHGHQLALTAGLSICRGERVLIIDADLQDPPELLPEMLAVQATGADVVYGQRRHRAGESTFKLVTAAVFYRMIGWLSDIPIPRDTGDFRLMSRRALDVLMQMPERHRFIRGMVSWIGFVQKPVMYDRDPRFAGVTNYPVSKMLKLAIDAVTAFSIKPLRLAVYLGLLCAVASFVVMAYALYSWLFLTAVPGWTSSMVGMTLIGGVQLIVLGIMGEYLGRLYDQSKGRPLFIIRDVVRRADDLPVE
jgi:polyisoprenyl-phosphate glycosyltransferase